MDFEQYEQRCQELEREYGYPNSIFFRKLAGQAYERGHHAGHEEVLSILEELCFVFEQELHILKHHVYK